MLQNYRNQNPGFSSRLRLFTAGVCLAAASLPSCTRINQGAPETAQMTTKTDLTTDDALRIVEKELASLTGENVYLVAGAELSDRRVKPSKKAYQALFKDCLVFAQLIDGKDLKDIDACQVIVGDNIASRSGGTIITKRLGIIEGSRAREIYLKLEAVHQAYTASHAEKAQELLTALPQLLKAGLPVEWQVEADARSITYTACIDKFNVRLSRFRLKMHNEVIDVHEASISWREDSLLRSRGPAAKKAFEAVNAHMENLAPPGKKERMPKGIQTA